jgi:cation-transporting P-type ATPase D
MISLSKDKEVVETLKSLLEDEKIEKVMHACDNDIEWLFDEINICTNNIFDTQEAEKIITNNKRREGLDDLLRKYSLSMIEKSYKKYFQQSDWKKRPLSKEQLDYAAKDSFYLIQLRNLQVEKLGKNYDYFKDNFNKKIFNKYSFSLSERCETKAYNYFISNVVKLDPQSFELSKAVFVELFKYINNQAKESDINPEILCKSKILFKVALQLPEDETKLKEIFQAEKVKYNHEMAKQLLDIIDKIRAEIKINPDYFNSQIEKGVQMKLSNNNTKTKDVTRSLMSFAIKGLAYENCRMLAPDGELLCTCDSKKMNWYISRRLAKEVSNDPPTFQLLFEPRGRGSLDDEPLTEFNRRNCCVVCEKEEHYMKFHVVPSLYRQFFPDKLKSHRSHDVVLLCYSCMENANKLYDMKKKEISERFNVPLNVVTETQLDVKSLSKIIFTSNSIIKNIIGIPDDKKLCLLQEILEFLSNNQNQTKFTQFFNEIFPDNKGIPVKVEDINETLLIKIKNFRKKEYTSLEKKNFHGKLVIEKIENFKDFIIEWRSYFIKVMSPKYLPETWRIDSRVYSNFGEKSKFSGNDQRE